MPNPPELRKLLTDALRKAGFYTRQADTAVDVLLSLPGIAITQLPEPTEGTDVGFVFSEGSVAGTVLAADYAVCHQGWEYTAEQARDVGAQWIAAAARLAAVAEADHA